jgi:hypothetical protein
LPDKITFAILIKGKVEDSIRNTVRLKDMLRFGLIYLNDDKVGNREREEIKRIHLFVDEVTGKLKNIP